MKQCLECQSELTDVDAFCPYCGIAIAPVIPEREIGEASDEGSDVTSEGPEEKNQDSSEDSFDMSETIVVGAADRNHEESEAADDESDNDGFVDVSELSQDAGAAATSPAKTDSDGEEAELEASDDVEGEHGLSGPDGDPDSSDDDDTDIDVNELAPQPSPDESFLEDSTTVMSREDLGEEIADSEDNEDWDVDTIVKRTDDEVKSSALNDSESEMESDESPLEPVSEKIDSQMDSDDEVDGFSKTVPYVSADFEDLKDAVSKPEAEEANEEPSEGQDTFDELKGESEPIHGGEIAEDQTAEESIDEPSEELEAIEESLSEVEQEEEVIAADGEPSTEKPGGIEVAVGEVDVRIEEPVAADSGSVESGEVSHGTTPNIGVEDTDGSNKTKLKPLDEGTVLNNRYEIVRKIGGGGMGAVYLANDKNLGGVLRAVKEMVQSYIEEEQQEKAVNDFKRESMLLTSLEHSSIPTIYDYFFDDQEGRFYLVMKYISGGDLAGKLKSAPEGKLDEKSVVEWGIQIADVLDYLHNRQPPIVYRDLKPSNVMIDGNSQRVMLIDFGIARWVNKEEKGVTAVGTMGYAPPELFSGNVEPRSDIYSLGSTMFHLLTGADPQSNPLLIFDFEKHPRPRQINSALSDQMEQILMRAVEYNAEGRFNSAAEMRNTLAAHLDKLNAGTVSFGEKETPKAIGLANQPVFCGFCGQKIVATDMFCAFCGAKQPLAQPGVQSQEYIPVEVTAKLMIEGTSELNVPAFSLEKDENLIGRRDPISNIFPEVDLSKFDPQTKISRKHARILREGSRFILEDLNSSNGTVLKSSDKDSVRLTPHQSKSLENGDRITMGDTTLQFVIG